MALSERIRSVNFCCYRGFYGNSYISMGSELLSEAIRRERFLRNAFIKVLISNAAILFMVKAVLIYGLVIA